MRPIRTLVSLMLALAITVTTLTVAPEPAEAASTRKFHTYYTTSTNSFEFNRLKKAAPYYQISPRFHRNNGEGIIGKAQLYVNGRYQRWLRTDNGRVTFRINRSEMRDNETTRIAVRLIPKNGHQHRKIATKWVIDRPVGWRVAQYAKHQLGDRYRYGAAGPNVFDCSGLVVYVYRQVTGKRLPHYSGALRNAGSRVRSPRPGDIVWTKGHVSIYAGGGKVVEAASPGTRVRHVRMWQRGPVYVRV